MESALPVEAAVPFQVSSLMSNGDSSIGNPLEARVTACNATLTVSDGSRIHHIRDLDLNVISQRSPTFAALFELGQNGSSRLEIEERLSIAKAFVAYLCHGDYRESANSAFLPYSLHLRMYDQAHLFGVDGLAELAFNCLREKARYIADSMYLDPVPAYVIDDLIDGLKAVYDLRSEESLIRPVKDELLQVAALNNGPFHLTENMKFQTLVVKIPSFYDEFYAMEGSVLPQLYNTGDQKFESKVIPSITDVFRWCPETPKSSDGNLPRQDGMNEPGFVEPASSDGQKAADTLEKIADSHTRFDQYKAEDVAAMEAILLEGRERALKRGTSQATNKGWEVVHRPKPVLHFDDTDPDEGTSSAFDPLSATESEAETENESDAEGTARIRREAPPGWHSIDAIEGDMQCTVVLRPSNRRLQFASDADDAGNEADDDEWTLLS